MRWKCFEQCCEDAEVESSEVELSGYCSQSLQGCALQRKAYQTQTNYGASSSMFRKDNRFAFMLMHTTSFERTSSQATATRAQSVTCTCNVPSQPTLPDPQGLHPSFATSTSFIARSLNTRRVVKSL